MSHKTHVRYETLEHFLVIPEIFTVNVSRLYNMNCYVCNLLRDLSDCSLKFLIRRMISMLYIPQLLPFQYSCTLHSFHCFKDKVMSNVGILFQVKNFLFFGWINIYRFLSFLSFYSVFLAEKRE